MFLASASVHGHARIYRELYLPQSCDRCRVVGIPTEGKFTTTPRQAGAMISRVIDSGVPFAWFTGDEVYGQAKFQAWLEEDVSYVPAIRRSDTLTTSTGEQRPMR